MLPIQAVLQETDRVSPLSDQAPDEPTNARGSFGIATRLGGSASVDLDEQARVPGERTHSPCAEADPGESMPVRANAFQTDGDCLRSTRACASGRPEPWRVGPEAGEPACLRIHEVDRPAPDMRGTSPARIEAVGV